MQLLQRIFGRKKRFAYDGPNVELVQAMHAIALRDDAGNRKVLYQAILSSTLTIPTPELPEEFRTPGVRSSTPDTRIQMIVIETKDGKKATPAFTDRQALEAWDPNAPSLGLKPQALFQMVMETDIQQVVINPFDPIRKMTRPGGFVTRAEMDLLAKGLVPTRIGPKGVEFQMKTDQKVPIGVPAVRPAPDVEETLKTAATLIPEIAELYLFHMATPTGTSLTVIGIQLDPLRPQEHDGQLCATLGEAIQPKLKDGQSLDFLVLRSEFGKAVKAQAILIFRRS